MSRFIEPPGRGFALACLLLFPPGLSSCAGTPPLEPYALAREALSMARKYEGDKWAPRSYRKAAKLYKNGEKAFANRYYSEAAGFFEEAVEYAERAENTARLKESRYKSAEEE